jgi:methylated-DNA-protein-cysteine methyltransferase-like protein
VTPRAKHASSGRARDTTPTFYDAVWSLVRRVPRGRVVSYGQVATWLGSPRAARAVGYAMFNVNDPAVPWQRVVNGKGEISIGGALDRPELQRALLEAEGVSVDAAGRLDFGRFGWAPERRVLRSVASSAVAMRAVLSAGDGRPVRRATARGRRRR